MNPKLQKLIAQRERITSRITVLQGQLPALNKKITEQENLELHSLMREANMTYQDLAAFIQSQTGQNAPAEEKQEVTDETD